jgi:hypothetical protein
MGSTELLNWLLPLTCGSYYFNPRLDEKLATNSCHINLLPVVLGNIKMQQFMVATMKACKKCGFMFNKSAKHVSNINVQDGLLLNVCCTYTEFFFRMAERF